MSGTYQLRNNDPYLYHRGCTNRLGDDGELIVGRNHLTFSDDLITAYLIAGSFEDCDLIYNVIDVWILHIDIDVACI